jgi:3-hydroxybutyryl-CoA dehydrogenase
VASAQKTHGVKTLGVVGAGQMGGGIAQVASQVAGVRVVLVDSQQAQLERALQTMGACLAACAMCVRVCADPSVLWS